MVNKQAASAQLARAKWERQQARRREHAHRQRIIALASSASSSG